jgi:hypothetical protein
MISSEPAILTWELGCQPRARYFFTVRGQCGATRRSHPLFFALSRPGEKGQVNFVRHERFVHLFPVEWRSRFQRGCESIAEHLQIWAMLLDTKLPPHAVGVAHVTWEIPRGNVRMSSSIVGQGMDRGWGGAAHEKEKEMRGRNQVQEGEGEGRDRSSPNILQTAETFVTS